MRHARRLPVLALLAVLAGVLSIAPVARGATTLTVCHGGCSYPTIEPAVAAASNGDTVEVLAGTYTQQVTVDKDITLEGDPGGARPLLTFAPSSGNEPTLQFTSAASGSTLKYFDVRSNGSFPNGAIDFDQAGGTIADVSATSGYVSAGSGYFGLLIDATNMTVGPNVAATVMGTGGYAVYAQGSTGSVTGLTATDTGIAYAAAVLGSMTVTDSTFTGTEGADGLGTDGTVRAVKATGAVGVLGGALITDSLVIGTEGPAVQVNGPGPLQLRNVTAVSDGADEPALEAEPGYGGASGGAIVAENVIARGGPGGDDVEADPTDLSCEQNPPCAPGTLEIGYSNFVTASNTVDTTTIGHNQSADPQFVDGTVGPSQDFHLLSGSPAIGAGTSDAYTGTTDLDGAPRPAATETEPSIGAYEPIAHTLTVSVSGRGTVTGPGLNCTGPCSKVYLGGPTVTLSETPAPGSVFAGWGGACSGLGSCQVSLASDRSVSATFTPVPQSSPTALTLSGVHLGSHAFAAKKGTALTLTLSEAATVHVLVTQARAGRTVKGVCKPGAKHGKRCTLTVTKAKRTFNGGSGANRFKLLVRSLAPGRYTATVTALANGQSSTAVALTFTIVKPKSKAK